MKIGEYKNGVLVINEGITTIPAHSICDYDGLRKIVFPSSLTTIEESAISNQEELEELDFSKVTKLKEIPEYMLYRCGEDIRRFVIPQGVRSLGDGFLCSANPEEIYVPDSVVFLGYPIDIGEEMDGTDIYVYAHDVDFNFHNIVDLTLYVLPQDYEHYKRKFEDQDWWKDLEDDITIRKMPDDKLDFYERLTQTQNQVEDDPIFCVAFDNSVKYVKDIANILKENLVISKETALHFAEEGYVEDTLSYQTAQNLVIAINAIGCDARMVTEEMVDDIHEAIKSGPIFFDKYFVEFEKGKEEGPFNDAYLYSFVKHGLLTKKMYVRKVNSSAKEYAEDVIDELFTAFE